MPTGGSCIRTAGPTPRHSGARLAAIHGIELPDCGRSPAPPMGRERSFVRSGRGVDRSPALRAPEQMLGEGARGTIDVGENECYRE
jgi:hypothetical protein